MKFLLSSFLAGLLFGLGLAVSHMTNPNKVIGFLNIARDWDPSLLLVLASAVLIAYFGFRFAAKREFSLFNSEMEIATRRSVDGRLLTGAAIFGVGWGIGGYCPGPAIAASTAGRWEPILFILAMLLGSLFFRTIDKIARKMR